MIKNPKYFKDEEDNIISLVILNGVKVLGLLAVSRIKIFVLEMFTVRSLLEYHVRILSTFSLILICRESIESPMK